MHGELEARGRRQQGGDGALGRLAQEVEAGQLQGIARLGVLHLGRHEGGEGGEVRGHGQADQALHQGGEIGGHRGRTGAEARPAGGVARAGGARVADELQVPAGALGDRDVALAQGSAQTQTVRLQAHARYLHRHTPVANRAAKAACSSAVRPSSGLRLAPSLRPTAAIRRRAQGQLSQGMSQPQARSLAAQPRPRKT